MVRLKFDLRQFQRILYNTQAWQRQAITEALPMGAPCYFQGPLLQRMTAEQAWDSFMTLALGNPDSYQNTDKGLLQRVIDIDLDKTDGKIMAQKIAAYQNGQQKKEAMMGGTLAMAGGSETRMGDKKVIDYGGMKLMRASEIEQPAPDGHFLREFGQSNREVIDGASKAGSQPQVLMLMNGIAQEMITNQDALPFRTMFKEELPKKQIETLYLTLLARKPTAEERTKALAELNSSGEQQGAQNLVWALINGLEFMFVQ